MNLKIEQAIRKAVQQREAEIYKEIMRRLPPSMRLVMDPTAHSIDDALRCVNELAVKYVDLALGLGREVPEEDQVHAVMGPDYDDSEGSDGG